MNVLLCGQLNAADWARWHSALHQQLPSVTCCDEAEARRQPERIEAAVVANPAPGSLQGYPRLRFIQSLWAGVDRLLADATIPGHVPIARMVDPAMTAAMAQTALWATLALHRGFFAYARRQAQARWQQHPQRRADEVPVLVLGYGEMGRTAAQAIAAQGYAVRAWRRREGDLQDGAVQVSGGAQALWTLLPRSAIVINLLPLSPHTRGLLDARLLAALPPKAGLANLARGAHVVDADLLQALDTGHLRHAVLDVFHQEPLPPDHRYWTHPRVTVLPHAAALTDERSAVAVVVRNLARVMRGEGAEYLVGRGVGY